MIAYLMKKHLGVEPSRLSNSVPQQSMSMTNQMRWPTPTPQNWISWGDPKEPVSEYQMMYDQGAKQFNPKEIEKIKKSALWRNMSIIQNAMAKTSTTFTPTLKQGAPERGKKGRRYTKNGEAMLGSYGRNTQNGDKEDTQSLTSLPKIR